MTEQSSTRPTFGLHRLRIDLIAFAFTFLVGLIAYSVLRLTGQSQLAVSAALVFLMSAYAFIASTLPRLRVRLDQAGDNCYYLGLLFTLVSMSFALYEFGNSVELTGVDSGGAQKIIANFGIALASTITGILLRLLLHQMRVDPADVEAATRIELADAAQQVRAKLESVSTDIGLFHHQLLQRASDLHERLKDDAEKSIAALSSKLQEASEQVFDETKRAHAEIRIQSASALDQLTVLITTANGAVDRLASVELPPTRLATRLEKAAGSLERLDGALASLEPTLTTLRISMQEGIDGATAAQVLLLKQLADAASALNSSLEGTGKTLAADRQLLDALQSQAADSAVSSKLAQDAATEVLRRFTDATDGLTSVLSRSDNAKATSN